MPQVNKFMLIDLLVTLLGLALLVWSADRFVAGSASLARHFHMSPLLIGMVIVGFGTSIPELLVSAFAASQGNAGIALGNAYGSNITNIALILGLAALISPIAVHSNVLRKELPILVLVTIVTAGLIRDGTLSHFDAIILLSIFVSLMTWTILEGLRNKVDALGSEMAQELAGYHLPIKRAVLWLFAGLILLIVSSRILVWEAVKIAQALGVSDLIIGLTIVAVGTSLPELASSVMAARKGEHDIALGNILGSNLFNTLVVVGLAGSIRTLHVDSIILVRDVAVMAGLTCSLFIICYGFRGHPGRINRIEGAILLAAYAGYTIYLIHSAARN